MRVPTLVGTLNCVEFSWDDAKRAWVLAERGIDFLRIAQDFFDAAHY